MNVLDAAVHAGTGQYWISDLSGQPEETPGVGPDGNGLISTTTGLAIVNTGTMYGPIEVVVEVHRSAPPVRLDTYDDVVEVSLTTTTGHLAILEVLTTNPPKALLTPPLVPGTELRLRVSAHGRDDGQRADVVTDQPVERHLLQIWPAPPAAETRHKLTDQTGQGNRGTTV